MTATRWLIGLALIACSISMTPYAQAGGEEEQPGFVVKEGFDKNSPFSLLQTDCDVKTARDGLVTVNDRTCWQLDVTLGKGPEKAGNRMVYRMPFLPAQIGGKMPFEARLKVEALPQGAKIHVGFTLSLPGQNGEHAYSAYVIDRQDSDWHLIQFDVARQLGQFAAASKVNAQGARATGIFLFAEGNFNGDRVSLLVDDVSLHSSLLARRQEEIRTFNETGIGTTSFDENNEAMPLVVYVVMGDGLCHVEVVNNAACLLADGENLYFNVDDSIVSNSRLNAKVRVTYVDRGRGSFTVQYAPYSTAHRPNAAWWTAPRAVTATDTNKTLQAEFEIKEAAFNNSLYNGDLRLHFTGAPAPIAEVALVIEGVSKERPFTQYRYDTMVAPVLNDARAKAAGFKVAAGSMKGGEAARKAASDRIAVLSGAIAAAQNEFDVLRVLPPAQFEASRAKGAAAFSACQDALNECETFFAAAELAAADLPGVAWAMTSFETLVPPMGAPPKDPSTEIAIFATPGEFEPAAFAFFAARDYDEVTLLVGPLRSAGGATIPASAIDARVLKVWMQAGPYTQYQGRPAEIPELLVKDDRVKLEGIEGTYPDVRLTGDVKTSFKAGRTKQFWVTVRVPDGAAPGDYAGELRLMHGEKALAAMNLKLHLYPFKLDDHGKDIGIYYQGRLTKDEGPEEKLVDCDVSERLLGLELADMADHGITAPTCYNRNRMDTFIKMMKEHRFRGPIGFMGGAEEAGGVAALNKRFKEAGLGGLAAYIYDEPTTDEAIATSIKAADAAHAAGLLTFAAMLNERAVQMVGGKLDINNWMISTEFLPPDFFRRMKARREAKEQIHKKYWYYWQSLTEHPLTDRTFVGLYLFISGFDGICPYVYQTVPSDLYNCGDRWNVFGGNVYRVHHTTYPSRNGPITTIQWEGFREGVDDLRYLTTLSNAVTVKKEVEDPAVSRGRKLLLEVQNISYERVTARGLFELRKEVAEAIEAIRNGTK